VRAECALWSVLCCDAAGDEAIATDVALQLKGTEWHALRGHVQQPAEGKLDWTPA
jgi:hypothetical protein